jgi:hypothetical protein
MLHSGEMFAVIAVVFEAAAKTHIFATFAPRPGHSRSAEVERRVYREAEPDSNSGQSKPGERGRSSSDRRCRATVAGFPRHFALGPNSCLPACRSREISGVVVSFSMGGGSRALPLSPVRQQRASQTTRLAFGDTAGPPRRGFRVFGRPQRVENGRPNGFQADACIGSDPAASLPPPLAARWTGPGDCGPVI